MQYKKKLIEVALPLEAINKEAAREKSIRHGHPSTLHLWWARRPLAAARAVIWASLVDDPSSLPEQFPTEEAQNAERERLFKILSDLVKWENSNNQDVLEAAKAEIMKSTDGNPPPLLDPFAGGGAIPLEAQRLGLEAHASDLNPVAVMINKAMIEIPPKFAGQPPVNPEARKETGYTGQWTGAQGLAEDVRYYGEWMKKKAFEKIGHLYPKVKDDNGQERTVIAWIWARTVKCPNPACGCEMPLAGSFELSKKPGKEAYIQPITGYADIPTGYADVPSAQTEFNDPSSALNTFRSWHSRGYSPHFDQPNLIQSITFRLHDSVPKDVIIRWKEELKISEKNQEDDKIKEKLQELIKEYEDAGHGECYLKRSDIAQIIQDALLFFDGERYNLIDWCIMPNHVHLLISLIDNYSLSSIVHSWKSYTAKKANTLLARTGDFWMEDYYDRFIRDEKHFMAVRSYIRENPVKCGLVQDAEDWEWSSAGILGARTSRPHSGGTPEIINIESGRDVRVPSEESGRDVRVPSRVLKYEVRYGKDAPLPPKTGRGQFKCICCGQPVLGDYIKAEGKAKRIGATLLAIVAEGDNGRLYFSPDEEHIRIANCGEPEWKPEAEMNQESTELVSGRGFGFTHWHELFTNRQLNALTSFSDLVAEAQKEVERDGGSQAYSQAVGVYLAFIIDRLTDYHSSFCSWYIRGSGIQHTFGRQAIPMIWDFAEGNPFCSASGCFDNMSQWIEKVIVSLPANRKGFASQHDAQTDNGFRDIIISTDPPYYDNICYADLSDFFYIWLRETLKEFYPTLFKTMLVPKREELVASTYRFEGGKSEAYRFFEEGMIQAFKQINIYVRNDIPTTVYYAYKQSEDDTDNKTSSTGWETMLSALILSGFSITGTWPIRTEMETRTLGQNTNALASSIVLVCRKRPVDAPVCTRHDFVYALKHELKPALQKLQMSNIAPVDLAQSAIGPGMGVYSRFSKVVEADGTPMGVRAALQIINQELDLYFSEQDDELDRDSRFCIDLYLQRAFNDLRFGEADVLARAKNTSVEKLAACGVLYAQKGTVRLLTRDEIPEKANKEIIWLFTQQLTRAMEKEGVTGAAKMISDILTSEPEQAKTLAYRLFTIAERRGWAQEAFAYNSLVIAWPDVQTKAAELQSQKGKTRQADLFD